MRCLYELRRAHTQDKNLKIDWAKFGKYDLTLTSKSACCPPEFEGSAVGDAANWRQAESEQMLYAYFR